MAIKAILIFVKVYLKYRIWDLRLSNIKNFEMYFQAFAKMAQKMLMKQVVVASLYM